MIDVVLVFKGESKSVQIDETSDTEMLFSVAKELSCADDVRIIYKGKKLVQAQPICETPIHGQKAAKLMVMATPSSSISDIRSARSDPTIRGFLSEDNTTRQQNIPANDASEWGQTQHAEYKFCRFDMCTWQSFGTRPTSKTPHAFAARALLVKLAQDPGISFIMQARKWTVGLLAEMDPIDDRLAEKMEGGGKRLLGYNTNSGAQIHIRLRDHDLSGFLPYSSLVDVGVRHLCTRRHVDEPFDSVHALTHSPRVS